MLSVFNATHFFGRKYNYSASVQIQKLFHDSASPYECYCTGKHEISSTLVMLKTVHVFLPFSSMNQTDEPNYNSCAYRLFFFFNIRSRLRKIPE